VRVATIARVTSLRRLAPLAVVPLIAFLAGCGNDDSSTPRADSSQCNYVETGDAVKQVDPPPGDPEPDAPEEVIVATDQGDVKVSLDADKAPCTVNSFLSLAKQGFFDDSHCHRLTTQGIYVLQCGDPSSTGEAGDQDDGQGGPGYVIEDELVDQDPRLQPCIGQVDPQSGREVCTYTAGTVALAKGGPDSGGSQFFLVYRDSLLPNNYTVFGKMSAAGVKVVQTVAKAGAHPPTPGSGNTPPKQETVITSVK
jgi:peptidyl-prolyl cis-trans isomerase B (cyclophilin B)